MAWLWSLARYILWKSIETYRNLLVAGMDPLVRQIILLSYVELEHPRSQFIPVPPRENVEVWAHDLQYSFMRTFGYSS